MNNLPIIKVYEIDYEFIIKNYLDPKLWTKIWNIFVYKDNVFTLQLKSIDTMSRTINFVIKLNKLESGWNWRISKEKTISYNLDNMTIKILKKQINGAVFELAEQLDKKRIIESLGYSLIENKRNQEEELLRDIAEEFLDDNGVTNSDIRDVYIDSFVSDNLSIDDKLSDYIKYMTYNEETELLLIICGLIKDETRKNNIISNLNNKNSIDDLLKEIEEIMNSIESGDYYDEMQYNLIAI